MEGDLINVWGKTDGANTTGTFTLQSNAFTNTVTYIVIPKGFKAKIWDVEISGEPCDVTIKFSKDGGANWSELKTFSLVSKGILREQMKTRPIVVSSEAHYVENTSGSLIKFEWSQSTAGVTYLYITIELVKDE